MASIRQLLEVTTPVTVERGDIKIKMNARLERISTDNEKYQKLAGDESKVLAKHEGLRAEIEEVIGSITKLKLPKDENVVKFTDTLNKHLRKSIGFVSGDSILSAEELEVELKAALETLDGFEKDILPVGEDIDKKEKDAEKVLKRIEKDINENTEKLEKVRAERLAYLLYSWDITDGDDEDSPMWPITVENLMQLSSILRAQMLAEVEQAVFSGPF